MKSKKLEQKNTKKVKKIKVAEDEDEIVVPKELGETEDHAEVVGLAIDEAGVVPAALLEDEAPELPDEVGFDDLTDDEREMLGLEAKPKVAATEDGEENTGSSWEEFGYDEEELQ